MFHREAPLHIHWGRSELLKETVKPYNECKRSVSLLTKPNVKIKRVNICKTPLATGLVRGQSADSLLWKHWFVVVPLFHVTKLCSIHIPRLPVDYGSILSSCVSQAWIPVVWFLPVACWSVPEDRCFDFQAPQKPEIKMIISLLTKGNDKRLNKMAEKSRIKTQKVGLHKRQINEVI